MSQSCMHCRFHRSITGCCHRHAPIPVMFKNHTTADAKWPFVGFGNSRDWCGDFEPQKNEDAVAATKSEGR